MKPNFKHACTRCILHSKLGRMADIYTCECGDSITVLFRTGNKDYKYSSFAYNKEELEKDLYFHKIGVRDRAVLKFLGSSSVWNLLKLNR
jgi:hypothetical protein